MVRLIKTDDLSVRVYEGRNVPGYAILSHRWEAGEISLQELQGNLNQHKAGWLKLRRFCQFADYKGHRFVWIDTCCIDKTSSADLSEAINSMFKWYRRAERCYAYLYDVLPRGDLPFSDWMQSFRCSEWFERGWTLQELLAPRELIFVCRSWEEEIGTRTSLSEEVKEATGIPKQALVQSWSLKDDLGSPKYSIAQVMSWASGRHTTRTEDTAYSLMGLFHISMPLLYGEGQNAFVRLQLEIMSKYDDYSLFAWTTSLPSLLSARNQALNQSLEVPGGYRWGGLLAPTIRCFKNCNNYRRVFMTDDHDCSRSISMTSRGIQLQAPLRRHRQGRNEWLLLLDCGREGNRKHRFGLVVHANFDRKYARRLQEDEGFITDLVDCEVDTERERWSEYELCSLVMTQDWPGDHE